MGAEGVAAVHAHRLNKQLRAHGALQLGLRQLPRENRQTFISSAVIRDAPTIKIIKLLKLGTNRYLHSSGVVLEYYVRVLNRPLKSFCIQIKVRIPR